METLSQLASQMIIEHLDELSRIAVDNQYARQSPLWQAYGSIGYKKSLRDSDYHFSYLAASLAADDEKLFLDYIAWAKVLFAGLKFPVNVLPITLEFMQRAIEATLKPELAEVACKTIKDAVDHLAAVSDLPDSFLQSSQPHFDLAANYLQTVLSSDRKGASRLILEAVDHGASIQEIYLQVFQPVQREIGRLWQTNQVSVAQEHFCTAVTQMIMSQLYPQIFAAEKNGQCMIATSVSGELHEIGMRMVADFLEMAGWDTYYLGANTPAAGIISTIKEHNACLLAISATVFSHVNEVTELISLIRKTKESSNIKIMVGGYPFNVSPELWRHIGADGYAPNAKEAVLVAQKLTGKPQ